MKLNFIKLGSGEPMVILHGLFGSLDNWMTLGRRFGETHEVNLVDQRNHGHSEHSDEHSYEAMSHDLLELFVDHDLKNVILIGHSMGGKTAMQFAMDHSELIKKLVIIDIGPLGYEIQHDLIIRSMQSIDVSSMTSRKEADENLARMIDQPDIRSFLLKNIYRKKSEDGCVEYAWRFNLDVIANEIEEVGMPIVGTCEVPTVFVGGSRSGYINSEQQDAINVQFPNSKLITLNAGHWVHAEDPDGLYKAVMNFQQ